MAQIITVELPRFAILNEAELTADVVAGATSLPVNTEDGFDIQHALLIGNVGEESARIIIPTSVADDLIGVPALDNPYKKGTKIYKLRGHKARVYRAPNVNGSRPTAINDYSTLVDTKLFDPQKAETEVLDPTGGTEYWYLYTLYNDIPVVPEETDKQAADAIRGGNAGNYTTVDAVREEAGLENNPYITDGYIYQKMVQAESEINASLAIASYDLPLASVPDVVTNINNLLAAGYVLLKDYGPEHEGTNKDGQLKIKMARDLLKQIEGGVIELIDSTTNTTMSNNKGVRGYPDDSAESAVPSEGRVFSMTDSY